MGISWILWDLNDFFNGILMDSMGFSDGNMVILVGVELWDLMGGSSSPGACVSDFVPYSENRIPSYPILSFCPQVRTVFIHKFSHDVLS